MVFLTQEQLHLWLAPEEPNLYRTTRHKSHIIKVMFLAAVACPRFNEQGECTFDGKIGIWPFAELRAAQRNSANRPRGTMERKTVAVTKERYRDFLINKVIPAIKEKWPGRNRHVTIQQDGASSHIENNDGEFVEAATNSNWNIRMLTQSAQSPDTNINDLAFFRALQLQQFDLGFPTDMNGLIEKVMEAFNNFPVATLDNAFLTLQTCMEQIILHHGGNNYEIPHVNKAKMRRDDGGVPLRWKASNPALAFAREFLNEGP